MKYLRSLMLAWNYDICEKIFRNYKENIKNMIGKIIIFLASF
jgi:hypothetical protein